MDLLTNELLAQLLKNGAETANGREIDRFPVVKLFTPDANATWLLTEANPLDPDIMFGLCDLGLGSPELGYVSLSEIKQIRGAFGLPVERDLFFKADKRLSKYVEAAYQQGYIVT